LVTTPRHIVFASRRLTASTGATKAVCATPAPDQNPLAMVAVLGIATDELRMAWDEHGRQGVVIVAVLTLHVLFLLALLMRGSPRVIAQGSTQRVPVLFFIENQTRPEVVPPASITPSQPVLRSVPPATIVDSGVSGEPASSTTPPAGAPTIDWRTQAARSATAAVDEAIRQETRKCDPSERPNSFLPPCTRREHKFEWKEPRVGFSGGLPFIRLGERCAVGLGFFGCGFGAKPPANGDLFEHMDDPERDRSSVPALAEPHSQRQHVPSLPAPDSGRSDIAQE
jgi:hypothetical protein